MCDDYWGLHEGQKILINGIVYTVASSQAIVEFCLIEERTNALAWRRSHRMILEARDQFLRGMVRMTRKQGSGNQPRKKVKKHP